MAKTENLSGFTLRLGTRASKLALFQARLISRMLKKAHPGLRVKLVKISTTGDQVTDRTLKSFGGAGVFVTELEQALEAGRIDAAVHSLKDMPTSQPRGMCLAATVGREITHDVAVVRDDLQLADLPRSAVIGTGSERRRAQLKQQYPHMVFKDIRGNVETRLQKVADGQYSATILAGAGLKRLKLLKKTMQILPIDTMLPAPGQGALGLECRSTDRRVRRLLWKINNAEVMTCTVAERQLLQLLGGGCNLPLGALCTFQPPGESTYLRLQAFLGLADGSMSATVAVNSKLRYKGTGLLQAARRAANLAYGQLLERGAEDIIARLEESQPNITQKLK